MKALDFIQINTEQPDAELERLNRLHAQLAELPPDAKRKLAAELLSIAEDREAAIWPRVQACTILGGRRHELGLAGSKEVARRIRHIIEAEFLQFRRSGFPRMKISPPKPLDQLTFSLLQVLAATLCRIDSASMAWIRKQVASKFDKPYRDQLDNLISEVARNP